MKKLILLFSIFVLLLSLSILLFNKYKDNEVEEEAYAIKTSYAYLSKGSLKADIKLYTNSSNSLIKYATDANTTLHSEDMEVLVNVEVVDVYNSSNTYFLEENYYEYALSIKIDITSLEILDCYLSLKFTNKTYTFNIGSIEIKENLYEENVVKIVDLYGVSSRENLSLAAIIITINNDKENRLNITNVSIGNNYQIILDSNNLVEVKDSTLIEDYTEVIDDGNGNLIVEKNSKKTYILPIKYLNDFYLYNCYILFEIDGITFYLSNYNYINSNDLEAIQKYLSKGMIYEI